MRSLVRPPELRRPSSRLLRYGQRVSVVVLRAPDILKTEKGLELVGPRAFGYDLEFRSVFE